MTDIPTIVDGKVVIISDGELKRAVLACELVCNRCGHHWIPRSDTVPKVCPNPECKSPYWNKQRVRRKPRLK